jgi:hypothetical protein
VDGAAVPHRHHNGDGHDCGEQGKVQGGGHVQSYRTGHGGFSLSI